MWKACVEDVMGHGDDCAEANTLAELVTRIPESIIEELKADEEKALLIWYSKE